MATLNEYKQMLAQAAKSVPDVTAQDVQNAASYAFPVPTKEDVVQALVRSLGNQAAVPPAMPASAATPQQQSAVAAQASPVASQAASMAAKVQNDAQNPSAIQAGGQTDFSKQLADVVAQANDAGIGQPLSYGERGVLSQILGAKNMYDAAQNDAERAQAHAIADAYRQAGARYGMDDTTSGLDATQLRALLQTDYDMGINQAMLGKTSGEYFEDQYQALRKAGLTRSEATDEAARRADRYQNERVRNLTNAYYMYGVDRDGSMNNNGAALLNLIYDEQPQSAAMGMQNFATPIQGWKFDKNMQAADKAYQQKVDYGQRTFGWNKGLLDDKLAAQLTLAQLNDALQRYNIDKQSADMRYSIDNGVIKAATGNKRGARGSGSAGGSNSGDMTKSQNRWFNNLQTLKQLAYQSLGTPDHPGTMFSDEDDHNVENYREELYKFRESGDADESDKDWVDQELARLQNDVESVSKSSS